MKQGVLILFLLLIGFSSLNAQGNKRVKFQTVYGVDTLEIGGRSLVLRNLSDSTKFDSVKYVSPKYTGNVSPFFSTITAALNVSGAGTVIQIMPGVYDEGNITAKDSVHFDLAAGVRWTYTANTATPIITFGNVFSIISGQGQFIRTSTNGGASVFTATSASSNVSIYCNSIRTDNGSALLVNGKISVTCPLIVNSGTDGTDYCLYTTTSGVLTVFADSLYAGATTVINGVSGTQKIFCRAMSGDIRQSGASSIQNITAGKIWGSATTGCISNDAGLQYITANEIVCEGSNGTSTRTISNVNGGEQHISAKKITSNIPFIEASPMLSNALGIQYVTAEVVQGYCTLVNITGGTNYYDIQLLQNLNDSGHCFRQTGGVTYIYCVDITGASQPSGQGSYSTFNVTGGYANFHVTDSLIARRNGYACLEITGTGGLDVTANVIYADSGYACLLQGTGGGTVTANNIVNKATDSSTVIDINSASGTWTIKNAKISGRGTAISGETFIVSLTTNNSTWWNCVFVNADFLSGLDAYTFYSASNRDIRIYGIANGNVAIDNGVVIVTPVVGSFAVDAQVQ